MNPLVTRQKGGVYLVENARWIYVKRGIYLHLLVFTDRKIQGFPIVFLSVNSSIRSIIRYFPITVNAGKRMFSWNLPSFSLVTGIFPCFPERQMPLNFGKLTVYQNSPLG